MNELERDGVNDVDKKELNEIEDKMPSVVIFYVLMVEEVKREEKGEKIIKYN